ncbi:hypothetical protein [Salinisphaera sp.]|uniref:hypothetical protein n=1 Tax=Salinisphaera sp. TaxID=1914330 RepID=UPI0025F1DC64|nr:hypothetical protein [Salinisphaera sp.]|tara:strand:+ start:438 stop:605 length:168 start_codon:yes stop_codon:yes gene_type:complete
MKTLKEKYFGSLKSATDYGLLLGAVLGLILGLSDTFFTLSSYGYDGVSYPGMAVD